MVHEVVNGSFLKKIHISIVLAARKNRFYTHDKKKKKKNILCDATTLFVIVYPKGFFPYCMLWFKVKTASPQKRELEHVLKKKKVLNTDTYMNIEME